MKCCRYKLGCFVALALLLSACASDQPQIVLSTESQSPRIVDFSGSWELDYELSEHPNDKLRYLYEVTRSQILQQQAAQRDSSRNGRPSGAISSSAINTLQGVIGLGQLAEKITRSNVLVIEQSSETIAVQRDGDFALTCDFFSEIIANNPLGHESCGWQGDHLIFNVSLPEGLNVNHRLILSGNGERLSVSTTVSSSQLRQPFTLNRVFMTFEPGQGLYDCEYTLAKKKTCRLGSSE
jgi:hypothetical protein